MDALYLNPENFRGYLFNMRQTLGLTQAEMAHSLGLSLRAYSDLENGKSETRQVHIMAAERLTLFHAYQRNDISLLAWTVRRDVETLAPHIAGLPKA